MTHDLFGRLTFKQKAETWSGAAVLPCFAAVGMLPEPPEMTAEEFQEQKAALNAFMEEIREKLIEQFGDDVNKVMADLENVGSDVMPLDPEDMARAERNRAKRARLLAKGRFPLHIDGPNGAEPTAAQEASFRFLRDNEAAVFDLVVERVLNAYQSVYADEKLRELLALAPAASAEDLKGHFALLQVDIAREARGGFAHLSFVVDSYWQDENGLVIVYSPDTCIAAWTTWDSLSELLESDEPQDEFLPTPHDDLLRAILIGDEELARELVASGADINALGTTEYPPLWIAADQMEPDEVRRLLAFGANPKLVNNDTLTTALEHARELYQEMSLDPASSRDPSAQSVLELIRQSIGNPFDELKLRIEEVVRLLEAAEAGRRK